MDIKWGESRLFNKAKANVESHIFLSAHVGALKSATSGEGSLEGGTFCLLKVFTFSPLTLSISATNSMWRKSSKMSSAIVSEGMESVGWEFGELCARGKHKQELS